MDGDQEEQRPQGDQGTEGEGEVQGREEEGRGGGDGDNNAQFEGEGEGGLTPEDGEEEEQEGQFVEEYEDGGEGDEGTVEESGEGGTNNGEEGTTGASSKNQLVEDISYLKKLLDDSDFLYDVKRGFEDPSNIKKPLVGFSAAYQDSFFPVVDQRSGILFDIVQEVERAVYKANEDLLRGLKEPVAIPGSKLVVKTGGPEIRLRMVDPEENLGIPIAGPSPASGSVPVPGGVQPPTHPELARLEKLITPAEKQFSPEKLEKLMIPFQKGWKREIVIRAHGASKKLGDVYYFSPDGVKYRSSKQVALYLSKHSDLEMTVDNFSFAKARVSYDPAQESVRLATGGRGLNPIKNMQQQQKSKTGGTNEVDEANENAENKVEAKAAVRAAGRRSIQPPKRYATTEFVPDAVPKRPKVQQKKPEKEMDVKPGGMEMGMLPPKYRYDDEEKTGEQMLMEFKAKRGRPVQRMQTTTAHSQRGDDAPFFAISSAFNSPMSNFSDGFKNTINEDHSGFDGEGTDDTQGEGKAELLPCSIRCPGMTGEVPTLQCVRCLCLYHPVCLGLPNQSYRNFLCANCEGKGPSPMAQSQSLKNRVVLGARGGLQVLKRSDPPPLIQLNSTGGISRVPAPGGKRTLPRLPTLSGSRMGLSPRGGGGGTFSSPNRLVPPALLRPGLQVTPIRGRGRGRPPLAMRGLSPGMSPRLKGTNVTITPVGAPSAAFRGSPAGAKHGVSPRGAATSQLRQMPPRPTLPTFALKGASVRPPLPVTRSPATGSPMSLLRRGGMVPALPRLRGPGVGMARHGNPGLKDSAIFVLNKDGRVVPRAELGHGQSIVPSSALQFQRYAQSVVTINKRKYVALPKNSSGSGTSGGRPGSSQQVEGEGETPALRVQNTQQSKTTESENAKDDGCVEYSKMKQSDSDSAPAVNNVRPRGWSKEVQMDAVVEICSHLRIVDQMKLRKVSKLWKTAVDTMFKEDNMVALDEFALKGEWHAGLALFVEHLGVAELDLRGIFLDFNAMKELCIELIKLHSYFNGRETKLSQIVIPAEVAEFTYLGSRFLEQFTAAGPCHIDVD